MRPPHGAPLAERYEAAQTSLVPYRSSFDVRWFSQEMPVAAAFLPSTGVECQEPSRSCGDNPMMGLPAISTVYLRLVSSRASEASRKALRDTREIGQRRYLSGSIKYKTTGITTAPTHVIHFLWKVSWMPKTSTAAIAIK